MSNYSNTRSAGIATVSDERIVVEVSSIRSDLIRFVVLGEAYPVDDDGNTDREVEFTSYLAPQAARLLAAALLDAANGKV